MFENLSTALIQAIGFIGVFLFFVYQLLSDNNSGIFNDKNSSQTVKINSKDPKIKNSRFFWKKNSLNKKAEVKKNKWF